ncbi:Protein chromatin remodeling 20 [Vitis vinifera]|uniref:Protein chromatin remodeling 20 n=1 Tax=Vitis vinifera TaxID=29760 RepID=A0A438D682_VITVI|nr:Protein chromatin remodeling 20 [Vitis vinifera]
MLGDSLAFNQMKDAFSLSSSPPLDISPLFFWVFCPFSFDASHSSSSSSLDDFPPFLVFYPFLLMLFIVSLLGCYKLGLQDVLYHGHSLARRAELLAKWRAKGGVFLIGYSAFRNLSLGKNVKDRHMAREICYALQCDV